jgi:hypothetical protein
MNGCLVGKLRPGERHGQPDLSNRGRLTAHEFERKPA